MLGLKTAFAAALLFVAIGGKASLAGSGEDSIPRRHRLISERQQAGACIHGAWSCAGQVLNRCVFDKIVKIADCTTGTVCTATGSTVGCFWAAQGSGPAPPAPVAIPANTPPGPTSSLPPAQPSLPSKNPPVGPNPQQGNVEDPNAQPAGGRPTTTILPGPVAPGPTTTIIPPVGGVSSVVLPSSSSAGTGGDTAPPVTNLTGVGAPPTGNYKAPHWVMYTDLSSLPKDSKTFPSAAQLKGVNRFILCFWVTENGGAFDNLLVWKEYPREKRRKILDEYHAAGIALMMAYGGDTEAPVTRVTDPVKTATDIAAYVKEYELDGVDVNYEELRAFSLGTAEAWVISFHKTLRSLLPRPYLISHAPVAPWFTTSPSWPGGGYLTVDKAVGEGIDWYNIQFYNQQDKNRYDTCDSLFNAATDWGAGSAVFEIHTKGGISLDKLVVGKPMSAKYQISSGLMDFATLGSCVKAAKAKQWTGGVMLWQMDPADLPAITTTFTAIRGDSWPV